MPGIYAEMKSPRRGLVALAILVVTASVGTALATVPAPYSATAPLHVAAPMVGDKGRYVAVTNASDNPDRFLFPWGYGLEFEVLPDIIDYEGLQPRWVNRFATRFMLNETVAFPEFPGIIHVGPGGTDAIAREWEHNWTVAGTPLFPYGMNGTFAMTTFGPTLSLPCSLRFPAQGVAWGLEAPMEVTRCSFSYYAEATSGTLVPVAESLGSGHRITVVDEYLRMGNDTLLKARLWLAEDVPYPVQIQHYGFVRDAPQTMYRLANFTRGTVPMHGDMAVSAPALPALEMAPRPVWTLEDAGVAHPFPLSEAWKNAIDARDFPDLRDFVAAHPKAYVAAAAETTEPLYPGLMKWKWFFDVTDGAQSKGFTVTRTVLALPNGLAPAQATPKTEFGSGPSDRSRDETFASPDAVPKETPTVRSLWAQVDAFRPADGRPAANSWGFRISCTSAEGKVPAKACVQPKLSYRAGFEAVQFDVAQTGSPGKFLTLSAKSYQLEWNGTRLDDYIESSSGEGTEVPVPRQPFQSASPPAGHFAPISTPRAWWDWTALAKAEAVSIVALLVATVYWAWPMLKSSALGLFSRVDSDDMLLHPRRAALMAAIRQNPGIHQVELARRVGGGRGAVATHLQRLVDAGLVVAATRGGYKCYLPADGATGLALAAAPITKSHVAQGILAAIEQRPGTTAASICQKLGVTRATLHYHVSRLIQEGLVRDEAHGREKRLFLCADGHP